MRDPWEDVGFAHLFADSARTSLPRAPLNSAISRVAATDRRISSLLAHAPATQRQPVLLLAALHSLVLDDPELPIGAWYPTVTDQPRSVDDGDLAAAVRDCVDRCEAELVDIISRRQVQTNEIGRCALLLLPLSSIWLEVGQPLARLDVGTSAGLTLLLEHLGYDYAIGDRIHGVGDGDLRVAAGVRGSFADPLPRTIPPFGTARGVDPRPLDLRADAQWLLACCWPDERARFERLRRAIELARSNPPEVEVGDAADVSTLVRGLPHDGHPVVTTTWVLNYLDPTDRRRFVDDLELVGQDRDLDWVYAESPAQTPELPHPAELYGDQLTALVRVAWRRGRRAVTPIARCHPHGHWMHAVATA